MRLPATALMMLAATGSAGEPWRRALLLIAEYRALRASAFQRTRRRRHHRSGRAAGGLRPARTGSPPAAGAPERGGVQAGLGR
jgi:hypothetical protein